MTGVRPDRSGVPANAVYDRAEQVVRDPRPAGRPALPDRPPAAATGTGYTTGTVLSKEYLYGIFGTRATYRWEPEPVLPVTGHAPDAFTMDAAIAMVEQFDPNLVFVNLGDCDRVGHGDLTGTTLQAARHRGAGRRRTHRSAGSCRLLQDAAAGGEHSVVIVLADHSMDWSRPDALVSLQPAFDADPLLAGNVQIADNGGADLLYWTGPAERRTAAVATDARDRRAPPTACCPRTARRLRLGAPRRRPGGLLQGRAGGSATRTSCPTRSPATTGTRRRCRSRSSSAAARRWCRTGPARRHGRARPTWRRPSARSSGSARRAAGTTVAPASDAPSRCGTQPASTPPHQAGSVPQLGATGPVS